MVDYTGIYNAARKAFGGIEPKCGRDMVLRMVVEIGEMIDTIKKEDYSTVMTYAPTRAFFLKELEKVVELALALTACYGVSPEEMTSVYEGKHEYNYTRWDDTPEEPHILASRAARKGKVMDFFRMQQIARELRSRYDWGELVPEHSAETMLWMSGEVGEIIEIIVNNGDAAIMGDVEVRREFLKEVTDVLMYLTEITIEFGFSPDDLSGGFELLISGSDGDGGHA